VIAKRVSLPYMPGSREAVVKVKPYKTCDCVIVGFRWSEKADGRISNVDLAARIHLSAPQCFRRVRSLEERGVIRGYRADVAPEEIGYAVTAYVSVSIGGDDFGRVREIEAEIRAFPQILECYSVSGEDDYLLKVVAHDLKSLSTFLTDRLMQVPGIDDVRSMICLEEIKRTSPLPIEP